MGLRTMILAKLGIGAVPSNPLTVHTATYNEDHIRLSTTTNGVNDNGIDFHSAYGVNPYTTAKITSGHGTAFIAPFWSVKVADSSRVLRKRLNIDADGNMSVGDIVASEKLHVDGNVRASGYKSSDGSAGLTTTVEFLDWAYVPKTLTIKNGLITAVT